LPRTFSRTKLYFIGLILTKKEGIELPSSQFEKKWPLEPDITDLLEASGLPVMRIGQRSIGPNFPQIYQFFILPETISPNKLYPTLTHNFRQQLPE
jgi:hypothetical protein